MKRTVVITGGTKGLGREIALAFARDGHFVVVLFASDRSAAEEFKLAMAEIEGQGCVWQHDVRTDDPSIWERPEIKNAESLVLVHNACASFAPVPAHQLRWTDFDQNLDVAVKGGWLCSQGLIRPMLKKGQGVIVNILSSVIDGPSPKGFAAYSVAKHALRGLTLSLASEYSSRGIRVFSVSPGFMDTPLTAKWDARLREMIRAASIRITDPTVAGQKLVKLVEDATLAGNGEDYPI